MSQEKQPLLIVTGLSGAGVTTTLKDLEDFGYEAFDNFPLSLADSLIQDEAGAGHPVAIGIDVRARGFSTEAVIALAQRHAASLLFLTADESILQKRFTETRRRHPLAKDRPVSAGIKREQELLYPLRAAADKVVDTSELSVHDLRHLLEKHFRPEGKKHLAVTLMSFGFRYGVPRDADIVMDIRFLKNPHWVDKLRPLTGRESDVGAHIQGDENFVPFLENFKNLVAPLLPLYAAEGKNYLTLAFGCTGGRHRSVFTAETLKPWLESQGVSVHLLHRDVDR